MKTGVIAQKNIVSEDIQNTKSIMGMSSKGADLAQYFLRDKIYSNKILAVIREYICNAYDEHQKHGIDIPVKVKLEEVNNQYLWSVRDFALGLNEHDVRNIFAMYFESTKSNDNNSIGGFGIGAKAAFSYTDTFYVNSHHQGTLTKYVCTLGAGTKGIPVGEIYKISEEPTTEQGIEISLVVDNDYYKFESITISFIKSFHPSAKIIYYSKWNEVVIPHQSIDNMQLGVYNIHRYDTCQEFATHGTKKFHIRMGGVVYPYTNHINKNDISPTKQLVVDVPIGKLTLPISRESIEDIPTNQRVLEEIYDELVKFSVTEKATIKVPPLYDWIAGKYEEKINAYWFSYKQFELFPESYKLFRSINRAYDLKNLFSRNLENVNQQSSKYVIYVLPEIKNTNSWHKRIQYSLRQLYGNDYQGYLWVRKSVYDTFNNFDSNLVDLSNIFFVDVKSLNLPALPKKQSDDIQKYIVNHNGHTKYWIANDLNEHVINSEFGGEEPEDDWYDTVDNLDTFYSRTIAHSKDHGTRNNYRTCNSVKLINSLKELGWITPEMPEYQRNLGRLRLHQDHVRRVQVTINDAKSMFFDVPCSKRTFEILRKNPSKLKKLSDLKRKILDEESFRGRIFRVANKSYASSTMTRHDLRTILNTK